MITSKARGHGYTEEQVVSEFIELRMQIQTFAHIYILQSTRRSLQTSQNGASSDVHRDRRPRDLIFELQAKVFQVIYHDMLCLKTYDLDS